jgi:hypothetical protein
MNTTLQRNLAPLVACLGFAVVPAVTHADDGGGDYNFPASNVMHEPVQPTSLTCAQATQLAWFNRAVEISDGDVSPALAMPAECDRKVFAKTNGGTSEEN